MGRETLFPVVEVAAAIIWRGNSFLAAKRPHGKPRAGFWEFPGGKLEPGETITQALCRELYEELGIKALAVHPWETVRHDYPDLRVLLHFVHVLTFSGAPVSREGQELRFVTKEQAASLCFLPADQPLIEHIVHP